MGCNNSNYGYNYARRVYYYQMNRIYNYLGKAVYSILQEVDLPKCYKPLNKSLLALANGCQLQKGHHQLRRF